MAIGVPHEGAAYFALSVAACVCADLAQRLLVKDDDDLPIGRPLAVKEILFPRRFAARQARYLRRPSCLAPVVRRLSRRGGPARLGALRLLVCGILLAGEGRFARGA